MDVRLQEFLISTLERGDYSFKGPVTLSPQDGSQISPQINGWIFPRSTLNTAQTKKHTLPLPGFEADNVVVVCTLNSALIIDYLYQKMHQDKIVTVFFIKRVPQYVFRQLYCHHQGFF
jgi:hypothetical protein